MNNEYKANAEAKAKFKWINNVANIRSIRNRNKLVVAHLNINSLRLTFDSLVQKITGNVEILMISETKLDNSVSEGQFDSRI